MTVHLIIFFSILNICHLLFTNDMSNGFGRMYFALSNNAYIHSRRIFSG